MEGHDMATRKTAPLEGGLIVRKGEAAPAAGGSPIAVTVKLDPELYWILKQWGMRVKPRQTNQDIIVEALREFFDRRQVHQAEGRL
jgi:hypothetical protein